MINATWDGIKLFFGGLAELASATVSAPANAAAETSKDQVTENFLEFPSDMTPTEESFRLGR